MKIAHLFCEPGSGAKRCGAFVPGTSTLAFHDTGHLSSAGSLYLWPFLCDFFSSNGLLGEPY
eukprot:4577038-Prymnesium_polylepis.1